jgi:hypothetical protein
MPAFAISAERGLVLESRDPAPSPGAGCNAQAPLRFHPLRPVIADERYMELREEIRWFTNQLGDARNIDVLLKRFSSGGKGGAGDRLRERLRAEREMPMIR